MSPHFQVEQPSHWKLQPAFPPVHTAGCDLSPHGTVFQSVLGPQRCSGCILLAGIFHRSVSCEQAASGTIHPFCLFTSGGFAEILFEGPGIAVRV